MYCKHKSMRGAELPRRLPHRDVGRVEIILHPRMGGQCVVPRNGPAYLGTKVVEDGGGDKTAVGPGQSRVPGEGATGGAKVGERLPGVDLEGSIVASDFVVAEVGDAGVVDRGEYEGLLGED